jgi:glycosyltransferase involved in cell wall biosynthesis
MVEQMGVRPETTAIVPVGVDTDLFHPLPHVARVPGRLMTTTSSDQPLKGLVPLLEALAKVRTEREDAHLVVIGKTREGSVIPGVLARLGLDDGVAVQFHAGVSNERLVGLYAEAQMAIVPSLYEGFSLPAIEAMACATPLIATTGGALPEVAGRDGESALLVTPDDPGALATTIVRTLDDADLRAHIGAGGLARVLDRFTWRATATGTVEQYRILLEDHERTSGARC